MLVLVIPKKDLKVRDPITKEHLKPEGEVLERSIHWIRREIAGDVELKQIKNVETPKQK